MCGESVGVESNLFFPVYRQETVGGVVTFDLVSI